MTLFVSRPPVLTKALLALALAPWVIAHTGESKAANVNTDCAAINNSYVPVTGMVTAPAPAVSGRPVKGVAFADPTFHTCVIRATDHVAAGVGGFLRNDYSRRQAFNANNTYFLAYAYNGSWFLYDANTLAQIRELNGPGGDAEPQWDPINPNILYYVPTNGGTSLLKLDVVTNQTTTAADFSSRLPWSGISHIWTKSEGSPSADGRYWCFMAEDTNFNMLGVFTYDLQTQTIMGTHTTNVLPDHVSMSASGRYCEISADAGYGGTVAWDRTFSTSRALSSTSEHSDLALAANGDDIYVAVDYAGNGDLYMVDLDTGVRTSLLPTYIDGTATAYHISGKAFSKPGWIVMGTYDNYGGTEKWLHQRLMAVELKANPTIINLAHHHSVYNEYWTEPHASVSRDFTHILFTSNWGVNTNLDVDAYMLRLPDNLIAGGTPPPPSCTHAAPTLTLSGPSGAVAAGSKVNYTVNLTNNDNSACSSTTFSLAKSVPSGWTGTLTASTVTLSAGGTSSNTLSVTSASSATAGNYGIGTATSSSVGSIDTVNASGIYAVATSTPPPPPLTCTHAAPTLSLTGPSTAVAAGSMVNYTVKLTNNDNSACASTTFNLAKSVPAGWSGSLTATNVTLSAGGTSSNTLSVTSTGSATAGNYGVGTGSSSSTGSIDTVNASGNYAVASSAPSPTTTGQTETVSTDKASYVRGETVHMTTRVLINGLPVGGADAVFTVFRPNGTTAYKYATTGSDGYARSSLTIGLRSSAIGTYGVHASATTANAGSSASLSFDVK
jgi:hypothetical protein